MTTKENKQYQMTDVILTDASFDKQSNTGVIGIIYKNNKLQIPYKAKNIYEGELKGIKEGIKFAYQKKAKNILLICDNQRAIAEGRKWFFKEPALKNLFKYVQFLWLPREYLKEVDVLSKLLNTEDAIKVRQLKKQEIKVHINETNTSLHILQERIRQFNLIKKHSYQSNFYSKINEANFKNKDIYNIATNEIKLIETDLFNIEDEVEKYLAQQIFNIVFYNKFKV